MSLLAQRCKKTRYGQVKNPRFMKGRVRWRQRLFRGDRDEESLVT